MARVIQKSTVTEAMKTFLALGVVTTIACVQTLQASFIVEPRPGGKAVANFSWIGGAGGVPSVSTTVHGAAPGLTPGIGHIYGGSVSPDIYQFSYTPGVDADNTVFGYGQLLGDNFTVPNYATGQTGGRSYWYNVYATWVASANIGTPTSVANCDFYVSSAYGTVHPPTVNQNTGFTGSPGGNAGWFLLGTVWLNAGTTYTVVMDPIVDNFVSMRSAGVMWELVPEPSTSALAIGGGLVLLGGVFRRRNR